MLRNLLLVLASIGGMAAGAAATFSVSPATIAYHSTNTISLAVGGIANGQAALIEEFADDNGNGLVDPGDQLLMSLTVHDGEVSTFPPSPGANQPGDEDGATNGAIVKVLHLGGLAERLRVAGSYVFRVSAVDASFAAMVRPFEIRQPNYPQAVTVRVLSDGMPVAFAFVVLLGGGEEDTEMVAGGISDSSGSLTVSAPVGSYNLIALKPGYVIDFGAAPMVSLSTGATNTQDVTLIAAAHTVSGTVVDAVTSNGIGGLQIFAQSQQGMAALGFTDANGNFTIAVTDDMWELEVSDLSARLVGYGEGRALADTSSGSVGGLRLALARGFGRFQLVFSFPSGSFNDTTNASIHFPTRLEYYFAHYSVEDDNLPGNVSFFGPAGCGLTNGSPSYSGGNSYSSHSVPVPAYPPGGSYVVNYKGYPQTFVIPDPEAANRQVLVVPGAVVDSSGQLQEVRWVYRNTSGDVISPPAFMRSLEVRLNGSSGQLYDGESPPDTSAHVVNSPIAWSDVWSVQMVYKDDHGNQYVSFWSRSTQPLQIHSENLPAAVVGTACNYLFVGSGGRCPYSWSIVSGSLPEGLSLISDTGELTGTPQANGMSNFRLRLRDDAGQTIERDFALTVGGGIVARPRLEIRPTGVAGEFGLRLIGEAGRSYSLEYSTTLSNWTTLITTNLTSASAEFVDRSATNQIRLYRVLVNP